MIKHVVPTALLFLIPTLVWAQDANHQPGGLGYGFIGGGTHSMFPTAGIGGEGYMPGGLGLGAEVATAGWGTKDNWGDSNITGLGSADLSYHFFPKKIRGNAAPFVTGGYTLFFGHNVVERGKDLTANGFNVGGGVDVFATRHIGARFDVRYYGHGGRILRFKYPDLDQFSFSAFRIGVTFR
jgi:opacity protein-like surface antigen